MTLNPKEPGDAALRRATEEWECVFDSMPDLIAIIDGNHRIVRANRAMAERLGATPEECVGKSCFASIHGAPCVPAFCPHALTLADGKPHVAEVHEERLGGDFLVSTTPLTDKQGLHIGSVHVARDITALKRTEGELRRTTEELARSNKDLEQFAYVTSHDLKEPLRMVSAFTSLLKEQYQGALDARAGEYIAFAAEAAVRMQTLVEDLLAYSRAGRIPAGEPIPADTLIDAALKNLEAALAESGAAIVRDPLPTVNVSGLELTQVFQNLIGNALKFRREGVPPEIRIGARLVPASSKPAPDTRRPELDGPCWLFSVRDNGIGIDPQFKNWIFELFQRLHTRDEIPGSGVGLAICRKIVERHGGRIWVESEPGKGSSFLFTIPA